jgi:hypothetical protein
MKKLTRARVVPNVDLREGPLALDVADTGFQDPQESHEALRRGLRYLVFGL